MNEKSVRILDPFEASEAYEAQSLQRCCEEKMQHWFLVSKGLGITRAQTARTKEEFYGFRASDVVRTHWWLAGFGGCLFFRLRDGRVIDTAGRRHDPNPEMYDQTIN